MASIPNMTGELTLKNDSGYFFKMGVTVTLGVIVGNLGTLLALRIVFGIYLYGKSIGF